MNTGRGPRSFWAVAFVGLWLVAASPVRAETAPPTPELVAMAVHGAHVVWSPQVSYDRLRLTVSGGGHIVQREFAAGEIPAFAPVDPEGFQLPDGIYKWEIKAMPRPRDPRSADRGGDETSAGGRRQRSAPPTRRMLQSGAFSILNGTLVDPNQVEEQAAPATAPVCPATADAEATGGDAEAPPDHD